MIRIFGRYFNLFEVAFYLFIGIIVFSLLLEFLKSILPQKVKTFFFCIYVGVIGSIVIGVIGRIFYEFKFVEKEPLGTALWHTFIFLFCFMVGINFLRGLVGKRKRTSFRCYNCKNRNTCRITNICIYQPKD